MRTNPLILVILTLLVFTMSAGARDSSEPVFDPPLGSAVVLPDVTSVSEASVVVTRADHSVDTPGGHGVIFYLDVELINFSGQPCRLKLDFHYSNGQPLLAGSPEYADANGHLVLYTDEFTIQDDRVVLTDVAFPMPYWALNMADGYHELSVRPSVYVQMMNIPVSFGPYFYYSFNQQEKDIYSRPGDS